MNAIRFYHPSVERSLINDMFRSLMVNDSHDTAYCGCVPANILEEEKSYRIELSIPGFSKEEIKIRVEKNTLTVHSDKKETSETGPKYLSREFGKREFERRFTLPKHVDQDQISAFFNNGILEITVPRKEEVVEKTPVEIEIQ